jgi:hypothetical protein
MEVAKDVSLSLPEDGFKLSITVDTSGLEAYPPSLTLALQSTPLDLIGTALDAVPKLLHKEECKLFNSLEQGLSFYVRASSFSNDGVRLEIADSDETHTWRFRDNPTERTTVPVSRLGLVEEIVATGEAFVHRTTGADPDSDEGVSQTIYQAFLDASQLLERYRETRSIDDWQPSRTRSQLEAALWDRKHAVEEFELEAAVKNSDIIEHIVADLTACEDDETVIEKYRTLITEQGDVVREQTIDALDSHPDPRAVEALHGAVFDDEVRTSNLLGIFARNATTERASSSSIDGFATLDAVLGLNLDREAELAIVDGLATNDAPEASELLERLRDESGHPQVQEAADESLASRDG